MLQKIGTKKIRKQKKSYLFPNPLLKHLDTNKKKTKSLPLLKIGHKLKI